MNNKDYEKLVKDYEKLHASKPSLYIMDFQDGFKTRSKKVLEERFTGQGEAEKISILISWLGMNSGYYKYKYYEAFKKRDMEMLNNALYETAVIEHLDCICDPGYDHAFFAFCVIPEMLAANLPDRIEKLIPREFGPANNGFSSGPTIINLLKAVWYEDEDVKEQVTEQAEKFLNKKITLLEKGLLECYLGFLNKDPQKINEVEEYLRDLKKSGDSVGAIVKVVADGVPVGLGEPVFDRLDADLAYAMMGINAVKGVEIGDGFAVADQRGSAHRDLMDKTGFLSNHDGGILGGISNGNPIEVTVAFKPTSSILIPGETIVCRGRRRALIQYR